MRVHQLGQAGGAVLGCSRQMTDDIILIRIWILDLAELLLLSCKFTMVSQRHRVLAVRERGSHGRPLSGGLQVCCFFFVENNELTVRER